ncbi:O-antigen ligase family protein [Sporosarcina sp. Marseille-Q4943]|uniref:O-antigen ligase family protein n=1 Tax=Sporosarcina sp. Marseille-Q4943 TaxID=2942204 RepID=UPI00208DC8C2|nr:O-antigen ligase family protein [Sporosarcina sp. Marseille-Q4943]
MLSVLSFLLLTAAAVMIIVFLILWIVNALMKNPYSKKKYGLYIASSFVVMIISAIIGVNTSEPSSISERGSEITGLKTSAQKNEPPGKSNDEKKEVAKMEEESKKTAKLAAIELEKAKLEEEQKKKEAEAKELLNVKGTITAKAEKNSISVTISTNVPDGGLFEIMVLDGNFNFKTGFAKAKDGVVTSNFNIPSEWNPAHFAVSAMFRFNLDEHPQPDDIKKIYGDTGQKMTGQFAVENHLGGKNANLETVTVAYPSEQAVKDYTNSMFDQAVAEMLELGDGVILDVRPRVNENWELVDVVVSDSWYYSADYEKERFAESIGAVVEQLITNSGKYDGTPLVYFVDSYGKDVATPKTFGGWKIVK